jgi:tetratricopeptide (TPR) repeat protein
MNLNCKFRHVFLALFLSICFVGGTSAQIRGISSPDTDSGLGGNNSITGTVFLPSMQRFERRVRVRLYTATRGDLTTMTDDSGNFAFRGLVSGEYTVVIDGEKEFETFSQQVDIIVPRGSPAQVYTLQARLLFKKNQGLKPDVVEAELATVPQRGVEFYKKAIELSKAGNHKGAIEQLELATAEYPKFTLAFNEIGVQYVILKDLANADESFQTALKVDPNAFLPLLNRGILLLSVERFSDAEPLLIKAVKVNEQSAKAHYFLAKTIANLSRFDEAEKEFLKSTKLGGNEVNEAHRYLAIIYSTKGNIKREIEELETYLRLVPAAPDAEKIRGLILKLKG